jgi:hypothetical protein
MPLRYQHGYLRCVKRKTGSCQWEFLWRENVGGCRIRRTAVIASIDQYPNKELVQTAVNGFRVRLNENRNRQGQQVILVADLIDHYIETELSDETEWRSQSTRIIHSDFLKRWVRPYWGTTNIRDVRTIAVETWLRRLRRKDDERALANATKAKIRNAIVPQGNVSPYRRATNPDSQYLKRVQVNPAIPIKIILYMRLMKRDIEFKLDSVSRINPYCRLYMQKLLTTAPLFGPSVIRSHQSQRRDVKRRTPSPAFCNTLHGQRCRAKRRA